MGYVEELINPNETIRLRARAHFFVIFSEIFREILILIVLAIAWIALRKWNPAELFLFQLVLGVIAIIAVASMVFDLLSWRSNEYFVTSRRVIHAKGVLNKRVLDSSLTKINDVILEQSFAGRIFGYGTIKILTATEEVINLLEHIADPIRFKHAMLDAKAKLEPAVQAASQGGSLTQLLHELSELKAKSMITDEEYQSKRKEVLKRF